MTRLAQEHGAINLSQGFPDFDGPELVRAAACQAIQSGRNQYARSAGLPELVEAIADRVWRHYQVRLDPMTQVVVFAGATEGLCASILALTEPGDEVVVFEPFYDSYPASVAMAGAESRYCTLRWPDFSYRRDELEALITPQTRLILLNTPHNPTGKVFSREELEHIAGLCHRHDLLVITDEVYESLTYDTQHIPIATLPGMAERTLTISSTGKTFSLTGWKIGYAWGPPELVGAALAAHQFVTYAAATPFQVAMAEALRVPDAFYTRLRSEFQARRDFLVDVLLDVGFDVAVPAGTYFILADHLRFGFADDVAFARHLTTRIGVACIPPSSFYQSAKAEGQRCVRFAFCKRMETLQAAAERLKNLKS